MSTTDVVVVAAGLALIAFLLWNAATTRDRPLHRSTTEAARLIDAALPLASILDPGPLIEPERFRDAVRCLAIKHEGAPIADILSAAR